jgi:hypothetical protein
MLVNLTNVYDSSTHRFIANSPPFIYDKSVCLNIVFASMTYFGVRLACVGKNATYTESLVYRSSLSLGYKQSQIQINTERDKAEYEQCSLVFESESTQSGVIAVINDVQLLPVKCLHDKSTFRENDHLQHSVLFFIR